MKTISYLLYVLLTSSFLLLNGCAFQKAKVFVPYILEEVAESDNQWTGVAVAAGERIFVCFPRWSDMVPVSVAELNPDGSLNSYPDTAWNQWAPGMSAADHFVCVQSVVVDAENFLWILDPANPYFAGVVPGGPKLLKVDLASNSIIKRYYFDSSIAPTNSYLNDVRIDTAKQIAYITDSGAGAIIVLDLSSGQMRRVLADHYSTKSDKAILTIEGKQWRRKDGSFPQVHADGIALDPFGDYLYYQALTGRNLFRIHTRVLRDFSTTKEAIAKEVQPIVHHGGTDGMAFAKDGNLYLTGIEYNAIRRAHPNQHIETVAVDERFSWPDSIAVDENGALFITTSQIHKGDKPNGPYRLLKLRVFK
jgi:sugar lactone lactonase YvrE